MVHALLANILSILRDVGSNIISYVRCRSVCCSKISVHYPDYCGKKHILVQWVRCTTPSAESPKMKAREA